MMAKFTFLLHTDGNRKGVKHSVQEIRSHTASLQHAKRLSEAKAQRKSNSGPGFTLSIRSSSIPSDSSLLECGQTPAALSRATTTFSRPLLCLPNKRSAASTTPNRDTETTYQVPACNVRKTLRCPSVDSALNVHVNTLDPFFVLPTNIDSYERSLVHWYFSQSSEVSLGLHDQAVFCPIRAWGSSYAQSYSAALRWIIVNAEEQTCRLRNDSQLRLATYRAEAYKALDTALKNDTIDHAMTGIILAVMGDDEKAIVHLKGLDNVIAAKGGFDFFCNHFDLVQPEHFIMMYSFCPARSVKTIADLTRMLDRFLLILQEMYKRARELKHASLTSGQASQQEQVMLHAHQDLITSVCVGGLLRKAYNPDLSYVRKARQFVMHYHLQRTLLDMSDKPLCVQARFLKALVFVSEASSARDVDGSWLLKPGAMVSMICRARQIVLNDYSTEPSYESIRISASTIEALKIFGYLEEPGWELIIGKLQSWITGDDLELNAEEIEGLRTAVYENWFELPR